MTKKRIVSQLPNINLTYKTDDIYQYYMEQGGTLSRERFSKVTHLFNELAMKEVVYNKKVLKLGHLGTLRVCRMTRSGGKSAKKVNWKASNDLRKKMKEEGKEGNWLIFFTDEQFAGFFWEKNKVKAKWKYAYRFDSARGLNSPRGWLTKYINSNPMGIFAYPMKPTSKRDLRDGLI